MPQGGGLLLLGVEDAAVLGSLAVRQLLPAVEQQPQEGQNGDGQADAADIKGTEGAAQLYDGILGNGVDGCVAHQGQTAAAHNAQEARHHQLGGAVAHGGLQAQQQGDHHGHNAGVVQQGGQGNAQPEDYHDHLLLGLCDLQSGLCHLFGDTGLKQSAADQDHGDQQNDGGVGEAGNGICGGHDSGEDQNGQAEHCGKGNGNFLGNKQNGCRNQYDQRYHSG